MFGKYKFLLLHPSCVLYKKLGHCINHGKGEHSETDETAQAFHGYQAVCAFIGLCVCVHAFD
jgi:hypothetical protein